jgi:hypothetical protein
VLHRFRFLGFIVAALGLAAAAVACGGSSSEPATGSSGPASSSVEIKSKNLAFDTNTISLPANSQVTIKYRNEDPASPQRRHKQEGRRSREDLRWRAVQRHRDSRVQLQGSRQGHLLLPLRRPPRHEGVRGRQLAVRLARRGARESRCSRRCATRPTKRPWLQQTGHRVRVSRSKCQGELVHIS